MLSLPRVLLIFLFCHACYCENVYIKPETSSYFEGVRRGFNLVGKLLFTNANQEPRKIKLFVASLPRTGTSSLEAALEKLGYNVLQGAEIADHGKAVEDVYTGRKSVEELFEYVEQAGFDVAGMDVMNHYWRWAAQRNMKVILTVRDVESWAKSMQVFQPEVDVLHSRPFVFFEWSRQIWHILDDVFRTNVTGSSDLHSYSDLEVLKAGYDRHVKEISEAIDPSNLLIFDVRDGWEPLCEFLGVPVPSEPFPHVNDRESFQLALKMVRIVTWLWPLFLLAPVVLAWSVMRAVLRRSKGRQANLSHQVRKWATTPWRAGKEGKKEREEDLEAQTEVWRGIEDSTRQPLLHVPLAGTTFQRCPSVKRAEV